MKIVIRKKSISEWLTLFVLFMPFLLEFLIELLKLPSLIKYTLDVAWICLLFIMLLKKRVTLSSQVRWLMIIAGLFFATSLIGFVLNFQTVQYYLWGIRNNIRFFVFFFACIFFIKEQTAERCLRIFNKLFWINFIVVLYQYIFMGKMQDNLGGLFGVEQGCNGSMNIFLLITITYSILKYIHKKERSYAFFAKVAAALLIAVLAELKAFFVELIILIIMVMRITKFSWKKIGISIGVVLGLYIGTEMVAKIFPVFSGWFSLGRMWRNLTRTTGYTGQTDMNRLTGIVIALNRFLLSTGEKLFGLGLGNCDYASFDFLVTPFYSQFGWMNYAMFSSAFLILETGVVGLALYTMFFVLLFFFNRKRKKRRQENLLYSQMGQILSVMCLVLMIYNHSLRTEAAYILYFCLALPYIGQSEKKEKEED